MRLRLRSTTFGVVLSLVAGVVVGLPPVPVPVAAAPPGAPADRSVAVSQVGASVASPPVMPQFVAKPVVWPSSGSAVVDLGAAGLRSTPAVAAPGGLPVTVSSAGSARALPGEGWVSSVRVQVADRTLAAAAKLPGVIVGVSRADGVAGAGEVSVSVDYSAFAGAFGGDFGGRLKLVSLPACVLTTPQLPACQAQTPVAGVVNNVAASTVSAPLSLTAAAVKDSSSSASEPAAGDAVSVLAVTAGGASAAGTWSATSLAASSSWASGSSGGDFGYSVPVDVPSVPGGLVPSVSLGYSSGSVDGKSSAVNAQPSWVGDGWDYQPGFVERSFQSCERDGMSASFAGDWCWTAYQPLTLVLNGKSTRVLWDPSFGWKTEDDSLGWRFESLTGAANGVYNGEYWRITTGDGTQYRFGSRPRAASGGALRAVVHGNNAGEPCYQASFANAQCWMGYRWNLDYVVDPRGNTIDYHWAVHTGKYGSAANAVALEYDLWGVLGSAEYGRNVNVANSRHVGRVHFDLKYRCTNVDQSVCDTAGNEWMWPDTPRDLYCAMSASSCPGLTFQAFWSPWRLQQIFTYLWINNGWADVDRYDLVQTYPSNGDLVAPWGQDDTAPALWLASVQRAGWPATSFYGSGASHLPNRVVWGGANNVAPMLHYRINQITSGTGQTVTVAYSGADCTSANLPAADWNTRRCYPGHQEAGSWVWYHKYVATDVTVTDTVGGSPPEYTHYDYLPTGSSDATMWAFDQNILQADLGQRTWSQWRGYPSVRTTHGTAGGPVQVSETLYYRGMHGDRTSAGWGARQVTINDGFGSYEDSTPLAGAARLQTVYDGADWASKVVHKPTITLTGGQFLPAPNPAMYSHRVNETGTVTVAKTSAGDRYTETLTSYDGYGRAIAVTDSGDISVNTDDRCAVTSYATDTGRWMISFPAQTLATNCAATPGASDYLGGSQTFYDGSASLGAITGPGNVTKANALATASAAPPTGTDWKQAGRATYDGYGRVLDAFDALDRKTSTAYSPAAGAAQPGPLTTATVTNAAGHVTTTLLDALRGVPTKVTDPNGKSTNAQYDTAGRLVSVWLNNRPTNAVADLWYGYWLRDSGPSLVHTKTLTPDGGQTQSYQLFDGHLRPRQTITDAASGTGRAITDIIYNGIGAPDVASTFYNSDGWAGYGGELLAFDRNTVDIQQRFGYDNLGRTTAVSQYSLGAEKWKTVTSYDGNRAATTIPPAGGTATTTILDARGQTTQLRQYKNPADAGSADPAKFDATNYTYTRLGQLSAVTDPAANQWTYSYDLRGRKTTTVDPDAGTSSSTYDNAGQVTSTADGRGQQLWFEYDLLGRKTRQRADTASGTVMADWTYDTLAKGQLTSTRRYDGANTYTSAVGSYDDGYRPLSTTDTVPGFGTSGGTLTYTVTNTYKTNGALATQAVPAVGGLPGETITHTYTPTGMPSTTSSGQATYIAATSYLFDGLISQLTAGTSGKQTKITNTFDPATRRLTNQAASVETSPGVFTSRFDDTYAYDPAGNILSIAGKTNGTADQEECFRYDYLRRLTEAWTQTSAACTTPQRSGADPYWRKWTFDSIGNRLTQTDKDSTDTTWTYQVGAPGGVKPHQLKKIDATGPKAGTALRSFSYDAAGNTTSRTTETGAAQTLTWDKEGHLATLTEAGVTTSYTYDSAGRRLIAKTPSKSTLYLPDGTELEKTGTGNPLGQRYYGTAVRDAAGLKWIIPDHQGTGTAQIDSVTLTVNRRRSMPYGETRGTQPSWLGTKGFVGGTKDNTGLTHLGAREYDPSAGRFISVDPLMDLSDPQQWNAYSYANGNPITFSDPSGLATKVDGGGGGLGHNYIRDEELTYYETGWGVPVLKNEGNGHVCVWDICGSTGGGLNDIHHPNEFIAAVNKLAGTGNYDPNSTAGQLRIAHEACVDGNLRGRNLCSSMFESKLGDYANEAMVAEADPTRWSEFVKAHPGLVEAAQAAGGGAIGIGLRMLRSFGGRSRPTRSGLGDACSFSGDTKVLMADGTTKPFSEIEIGDVVFATDPETGEQGARTVTHLWIHDDELVDLELAGGVVVTTTEDHPFWNVTDQEWQRADALSTGDQLLGRDGGTLAVQGIKYGTEYNGTAYNLTVADIHTYYVLAGNTPVLVHNAPPDGCRITSAATSPTLTSKTVWTNTNRTMRIDIENPVPGKQGAAGIHVQFMGRGADPNKYYFNPSNGTWVTETGQVLSPRIANQIPQSAVDKAFNQLGVSR